MIGGCLVCLFVFFLQDLDQYTFWDKSVKVRVHSFCQSVVLFKFFFPSAISLDMLDEDSDANDSEEQEELEMEGQKMVKEAGPLGRSQKRPALSWPKAPAKASSSVVLLICIASKCVLTAFFAGCQSGW